MVIGIFASRFGKLGEAECGVGIGCQFVIDGGAFQFFLDLPHAALTKRLAIFNMPTDQGVRIPAAVPLRQILWLPEWVDAGYKSKSGE